MISWKNPGPDDRDTGFEDYVFQGLFAALDAIRNIVPKRKVNAVGYCIGGTALSLTLALMAKRGDKSVNAATLFTTLTDFTEPGEVSVFLDNDFVDGIEADAKEKGVLESFFIARTFTFLRANDLVYGPAIRSYMMGKTPPAFDLLYWNGDGTNLPAKMFVQYLRELCVQNLFAKGGIEICGETLTLKDIKTPVFAITCETDHIAEWKSCYQGFRQFGSRSKTFVVSESGHIAGIINPPSKKKYGHYTNASNAATADEWLAGATDHEGSWWPLWEAWLAKRSGKAVAPRVPGEGGYTPIAPAPGTYVKRISGE
jgi:polyhydroxyalkanoate synthase